MDFVPQPGTPLDKTVVLAMDPLVLSYVGDAVQSLYVRTCLAFGHAENAGGLHRRSLHWVTAAAQAQAADKLRADFAPEEDQVYRTARNHKTKSTAKNATVGDYHKASGLEAVWGYLYLTGQHERLAYLLDRLDKE